MIELLTRLKDDDKEYVRRSVANNLNDIAKDHPETVAEIAAQWIKGAGRERNRMVRHACRSLIKNGHQKTLQVLGYGPCEALMIDYVIHHRKANGATSPKVFKWRTATLPVNGKLISTKTHTIKKITTRVYYPGLHKVV